MATKQNHYDSEDDSDSDLEDHFFGGTSASLGTKDGFEKKPTKVKVFGDSDGSGSDFGNN